jgi:hypothetical protein
MRPQQVPLILAIAYTLVGIAGALPGVPESGAGGTAGVGRSELAYLLPLFPCEHSAHARLSRLTTHSWHRYEDEPMARPRIGDG